jgi:hypothetical protein
MSHLLLYEGTTKDITRRISQGGYHKADDKLVLWVGREHLFGLGHSNYKGLSSSQISSFFLKPISLRKGEQWKVEMWISLLKFAFWAG